MIIEQFTYYYMLQKIVLGIIKERIQNKLKQYVSKDKFGFR